MITTTSFLSHVIIPQSYVDSITSYASAKREGEKTRQEASGLYITGALEHTNAFLLSDTLLLSQWFLVLYQIRSSEFFYFLSQSFKQHSHKILEAILLSCCIWFIEPQREPPDTAKAPMMANLIMMLIDLLEESIILMTGKSIDLIFWYHVLKSLTIEIAFEFLYLFIKVEYKSPILAKQEREYEERKRNETVVKFHECNKKNYFRYKMKNKTIRCNLLMSLSSGKKDLEQTSTLSLDTDSYDIAIDTCTSESICRERELFVGKVHQCKRLYIQGVSGKRL